MTKKTYNIFKFILIISSFLIFTGILLILLSDQFMRGKFIYLDILDVTLKFIVYGSICACVCEYIEIKKSSD